MATVIHLLVCVAALASLVEKGHAQVNCYNNQFFGCDNLDFVEELSTGQACCDNGHLAHLTRGQEVCIVCPGNGICFNVNRTACSFDDFGLGASSIHDCCLVTDGGGNFLDSSGVCNACSNEMFQCNTGTNCDGAIIPELSVPPNKGSRDACCSQGTGLSYSFMGMCYPCIVLGWSQSSLEEREAGLGYPLSVGYRKGASAGRNIPTDIEVVPGGTAVNNIDFTLSSTSLRISPVTTSEVLVTLLIDNVALEDVETFTLRLVPRTDLPRNAIFFNEISISIVDNDALTIQLSENDYRVREDGGAITATVTKNSRIANPLMLTVTPLTVDQAIMLGHVLTNVPPDDDPYSPNRAKSSPEDRRDFGITEITVTFEVDEGTTSPNNDVPVPVPVEDDKFDEADEEVFIIILSVNNGTNTEDIMIMRDAALCRIGDDDNIMIGFQRANYTFLEPQFDSLEQIVLDKEGGQISERTFQVIVQVTTTSPDIRVRPASLDEDYRLSGAPNVTSVQLIFPPDQQTLSFDFTLLADDLPEGLEVFSLRSTSGGNPFPDFGAPVALFQTTFILIEDDDKVEVGFETNVSVAEDAGSVEVCVRVFNVEDGDPLFEDIPLFIETIPGTADETDYTPVRLDFVAPPSLILSDGVRRACFPIEITNDVMFEPDETFSVRLILVPVVIQSAIITRDMSLVTIIANDDMCADLVSPENATISYDPDMTPPFRDIGTVASYTCDDGFALVGAETRECLSGTTWTGDDPSCQPICPDLDLLVSGVISYAPDMTSPFRDIGTVATHICDDGFVLVGVGTRECQVGGMWSESPPTCEPLCPDLDTLVNGVISYDPDMTPPFRDIETVATHSCDDGFVLVGVGTRECQVGGTWSGNAPTCEPICPDLDTLVNGEISYDPDMTSPFRDIGTVATHTCEDGFVLVGAGTRECEVGGMWSESTPTCEPICPDLDTLVNGEISYDPDMTSPFRDIGTVATHTCEDGFVLVGAGTRECQIGGTWSGSPPTCEQAEVIIGFERDVSVEEDAGSVEVCVGVLNLEEDDPFIASIPLLIETIPGTADETDYTPVRLDDLTFSRTLFDNTRRVCFSIQITEDVIFEEDETFSVRLIVNLPESDPSVIISKDTAVVTILANDDMCPDLDLLVNGVISYDPDMNPPFRDIGTVATHTCDNGFALVGVGTRECQSGTTWTEDAPTCQSVRCPSLVSPENGMISYDSDIFDLGTVATYECEEGFVLVGNENRTCTEGDSTSVIGEWSGGMPTCESIQCPSLVPPDNGMISYDPDVTPGFDLGTIATYLCNEDHILIGDGSRVCNEGDDESTIGEWSGNDPLCRGFCPVLEPPENGAISYEPYTTPPFFRGTTAVYICDGIDFSQYVHTRFCKHAGLWTGFPLSCPEPILVCPDLPPLVNGVIVYSPDVTPPTRVVGTQATHSCESGFTLVGNQTRTCQEDQTFSGVPPLCQGDDVRRVNDTAMGDPLMTVPLYVIDTSIIAFFPEDHILNLCFELHGVPGRYFNLVTDSCISVNAHYEQPVVELGYNVIDEIAVKAVGNDGVCRNISVTVDQCTATVDDIQLNSSYSSAGISVRLYRNRVRIAVPNCQNLDLVMWVFCEEGKFIGDPNLGEPDVTINAAMIRFVIARGFNNIRETAHGILGQFWNIPINIERYTGPLQDGVFTNDNYIVSINYPEQEPRRFLAMLDTPLWDKSRKGYCLYAGNSQGGKLVELESPNDSVIEGEYTDYMVSDSFAYEFSYSHFDDSECS